MSDVTRSIKSSIESQLQTTFGDTWSPLSFTEDVSKNPLSKQTRAYGVTTGETVQVDGVNRFLTFDQRYNIVLTEFYGQASVNDSKIDDKHLDLVEKIHEAFKALINTRAGNASVMNVKNLNISEKEILETEKVIVVRATIDITYRTNLGS